MVFVRPRATCSSTLAALALKSSGSGWPSAMKVASVSRASSRSRSPLLLQQRHVDRGFGEVVDDGVDVRPGGNDHRRLIEGQAFGDEVGDDSTQRFVVFVETHRVEMTARCSIAFIP